MLAEQGGGCAACGGVNLSGRRLAVDHDHATGRVRALLCDSCNVALGLLAEDPQRLYALASYAEAQARFASNPTLTPPETLEAAQRPPVGAHSLSAPENESGPA